MYWLSLPGEMDFAGGAFIEIPLGPRQARGAAMISMTTDYVTSVGCPEPYLRRIAEAGYTHVHWCHQWNTDFLYARAEIDQIKGWLRDFRLGVTDIHGSAGCEKCWVSLQEYQRQAGVELVENRIRMADQLGTDVVIMHICDGIGDPDQSPAQWDPVRRTLDELEPCARRCGVRIALENGDYDSIQRVLAAYPTDYIGMCYDSGHGNVDGLGLERLQAGLRDRLISMHLHDNDGTADQHGYPFQGTVDWERLARVVARSAYSKWVSLESIMANTGARDEAEFLTKAIEAGMRFARMIEACREERTDLT